MFKNTIVDSPKVTSGYGEKRNIRATNGTMINDVHNGLDIISTTNQREIYAMFDGKVIERFTDSTGANVIITAHGGVLQYNAVLVMLHAHLDSFGKFNVGDKFKKGDVLGLYGSSGNVTGSHLHLSCMMIPPNTWEHNGKYYKYDYATRWQYEVNPSQVLGLIKK